MPVWGVDLQIINFLFRQDSTEYMVKQTQIIFSSETKFVNYSPNYPSYIHRKNIINITISTYINSKN